MVITAKGNYAGVMKLNFKITKRSLKKASITGVKKSYAYTGKRIRPSVKVKNRRQDVAEQEGLYNPLQQ